jgi:hypothetical protein
MILPTGVKSFSEALRAGAEVYHNLKSIIKKKYGQVRSSFPQSCMHTYATTRHLCMALATSAAHWQW